MIKLVDELIIVAKNILKKTRKETSACRSKQLYKILNDYGLFWLF